MFLQPTLSTAAKICITTFRIVAAVFNVLIGAGLGMLFTMVSTVT